MLEILYVIHRNVLEKNEKVIYAMYRGLLGWVIQVIIRYRFFCSSFNNRCHKVVLQKYDCRFIFRSLMRKTQVTMARKNSLRQYLGKTLERKLTQKGNHFLQGHWIVGLYIIILIIHMHILYYILLGGWSKLFWSFLT